MLIIIVCLNTFVSCIACLKINQDIGMKTSEGLRFLFMYYLFNIFRIMITLPNAIISHRTMIVSLLHV